ncbi:MAG TPA: hypothetical protein VN626_02855 [Clostridia bacterium]|nr:hypothetical protein [Clostridia bacterium]
MIKINVLGTKYEVITKKYDEAKAFKRHSVCGFCDGYMKRIVICDPVTFPGWEHEDKTTIGIAWGETVRHEIVHAFLNESGLANGAAQYDGGWAKNEEMIDWFTLQGPKIYAAWQEAGVAE